MINTENIFELTEDVQKKLAAEVVAALTKKCAKVATAESCTGGYISKRITDIEGSSIVFEYGIVSYSNKVKEHLLGVKPQTLEEFTAVSKETAKEMASGVRKLSGAEIGVSVTGLAGNTPDPDGKPNGLVYVGVDSDNYKEVLELHLASGSPNDRELIRYKAASYGLMLVLKATEKLVK
ncbi:MAG: CinA family protein [Oscillospiraceae bacterium]